MVRRSDVDKALLENQKVDGLPNINRTVLGSEEYFVSQAELPEAVGRTLPWNYDGTV